MLQPSTSHAAAPPGAGAPAPHPVPPRPAPAHGAHPAGSPTDGALPGARPPLPRPRPQHLQPAPAGVPHPGAYAGPPAAAVRGPAGPPHARPVAVAEPAPPGPPLHPQPTGDGHDGSWALVKMAQSGDRAAFGQLFDRYYDMVFRFVLVRMNGDRAQAEDIAQETFVRALRRIGSVTYQGRDIGAWFVTIARNLIFDHVKSSRYRLEHATDEIVEHSPSTHGPEQQVLDGATNSELLRCVAKLNPDQQECITLRFLQGLSVAETAALMDRNEGAVKALQHRAVRRLAQLLPEGLR
jgi:RNA polymerase sigma-70 factor, ECF subfamily